MNPRPEKSMFEEAALVKGMAASFIEKDWYVTQVIGTLAGLDHKNFEVIFSGGTVLSKAHKLLQRFSEDVDFRVRAPQSVSRKALSNFKHAVIAALR
jgi:predicted nucleotidyltransferase component of viral defense system